MGLVHQGLPMKVQLIPPEAFGQFFSEVYGSRWTEILGALHSDEIQIARRNVFSSAFSNATEWSGHGEIPRGTNGLLAHYIMDPASIVAAQCLQVKKGDR